MKRIGAALIALGAVIWIAGLAAWISGVWVTMPPDAVRLLVMCLAIVSGAALVGAGALIGRAARVHHASPHAGEERARHQ